jgi:glutamate formiminotransferase / 5-formyltetrahydrofolate cyclo-ligase
VPERGGVVTVSMNLVDHEVTGLREAFDGVVRLAAGYGMTVTDTEIVGLVPASALADDDVVYLGLSGFDPDRQVLERLVDQGEE